MPLAVGTMVLSAVGMPLNASAAPLGTYAFTGDAFGSSVSVGSVVKLGATAFLTLGCGTTAGAHKSNTSAGVNLAPVATTGAVTTTAITEATSTDRSSQTTASTAGVNLLNGLVTASVVTAVATTTVDSSGFHISSTGSTVADLVIGNTAINVTPAANTKLNLPGLGSVVLNEEKTTATATGASITVNMIDITISVSNPMLPVGARILVSHATSDLEGPTGPRVDGYAYGTTAMVGSAVTSGRTAQVILPCLGTGGAVLTNTTAAANVPNIVTTGTVKDTTTGTVSATSESSESTSTVQAANVLSGLVTVDAVEAVAQASKTGSAATFSTSGSRLGTVTVGGKAIQLGVSPNTQLEIVGVGTLYLYRVIQTATSVEVRMIELVVNTTNVLGLPVGLDLRIGVAEASVH